MSEADGFISAIRSQPLCQLHRLVYADWLDDCGEGARAELLRVVATIELVQIGDLLVGKFPVTQGQYLSVMGSNPSLFQGDLNRPVEMVSWRDAVEFCEKLGVDGLAYRLPTEVEWQTACGPAPDAVLNYAWCWENSNRTTHPVGRKLPNAFGLYDTLGNVWEWCEDWVGKSSSHVLRGGSCFVNGWLLQSAFRFWIEPDRDLRDHTYGFRLAAAFPKISESSNRSEKWELLACL